MKYKYVTTKTQEPSSRQTTSFSDLYFEYSIYGDLNLHHNQTIGNKITQYLCELPEPCGTDVLAYQKLCQDIYPALAEMTKTFLALPESSSPSEGFFQ